MTTGPGKTPLAQVLAIALGEPITVPRSRRRPKVVCKRCHGRDVVGYGWCGKKPAYWCKCCQRKFVLDEGFKRIKNDPTVIAFAMDLQGRGVGVRRIAIALARSHNVKVGHVTVHNWLKHWNTFASGGPANG